jgi:hypothetical protein
MNVRNIVIGLVLLGAGFAVYTILTKKKRKLVVDRGFEFEVEVDQDEEND